MSDPAPPQIFDRGLINRRLDRAWVGAPGQAQADFLLARAAEDLGDRVSLVKRRFALAADFGSPPPRMARARSRQGRLIASFVSPQPRRAGEMAIFCRPSATSSAFQPPTGASISPFRCS